MEREKLPLKSIVKIGLGNGFFFAVFMAVFDYFSGDSFSILKFIFHFTLFGFFMALSFRYKYTKKKD
jgi:positive regulator of sigma E activity